MDLTGKAKQWFEKRMGFQVPESLSYSEWKKYYTKLKLEHPVRYFWAVTVPDFIDDIVRPFTNAYNGTRYWIRHRVFDRYHIVKTGLKPDYYDCSTRMLHANMNLMRDYVEVELAWRNLVFDSEKKKAFKVPRFSMGWLRFKSFRCPEAGLDCLDWETKLVYDEDMGLLPDHKLYGKPTKQALDAMEIRAIYNWWTTVYPNRKDPMDASGWSAYCDSLRGEDGVTSIIDQPPSKESKRAIRALNKIEKDYAKEEEQMLIRLMKIRSGLWT